MEKIKVTQLNILFEKMVSNDANSTEQSELNNLYQEFIDDGREGNLNRASNRNNRHHGAVG